MFLTLCTIYFALPVHYYQSNSVMHMVKVERIAISIFLEHAKFFNQNKITIV